MDARKLSAIVGIAAIASAAIPLVLMGSAGAATGHHAKTRVTIQGWPDGLFGVVKSPKANDCAKRRHITLFKKAGKHRNPGKDERVGGDVARRNNGFYQWTVQTGETGPLYARAGRTRGCERALSKTFNVRPRADVSQCTRRAPADVCIIGPVHLLTTSPACQNYAASHGFCTGKADGPDEWGSGRNATFGWHDNRPNPGRGVDYEARNDVDRRFAAFLTGHMFDSKSSALYVDRAQMINASDAWVGYTPDISGVPPGEQGGGLSFKIESVGSGGAAIRFSGYLYKKP